MNLWTRIVSWFVPADPGQPVKEAAFREAYGQTVDADEDQWRKLTGDAQRDLTPMTQQRMQKIALFLWEQNLLGNRLIELPVAFLLAEGVKLEVADEENQKTLERFWLDPINDMDLKLAKKARELAIFGEQCYPAFVNERDGMVRIGYLDPSLIETVVKDPDNPEQPIGVVTVKDRKGKARRYRVIINGDEEVFTERTRAIREGFTDGDAFLFRINDLSAGSRGRSDLLPQADWLDAYDQFMFGEIERQVAMRAFIWDVTLSNATEEQVKARAKQITAPKPMSVRVHNDSEVWKTEAPDLKSYDSSAAARLFRNQVLGGASIPEHWYAEGGETNRAVGAEMAIPTLKVLTMRQRVLKHMLESIGRYVLFQKAKAENAKVDWSDPKWKVQAIFPELSEKDLSKATSALSQVAAASASLVTQGLLSEKSAVALIAIIAKKLGLEIDAEDELLAAQAEAKKRREEQADRDNFTPPPGTEGGEAGSRGAMQEALDLIAEWKQGADNVLEELTRDGRDRGLARFAEALEGQQGAAAELAERLGAGMREANTQLVQALVKELNDGQARIAQAIAAGRSKTIELPDGRKFKLTDEVKT
jgi:hypothetical protein